MNRIRSSVTAHWSQEMVLGAGSARERYGVALLATAAGTGLQVLLDPVLEGDFPFAGYLIAIIVSAWYGGFGPAVLAVVLGAWGTASFLHPEPPGSPHVLPMLHSWSAVVYVLIGMVLALFGAAHYHLRRITTARRQSLDQVLEHMTDGLAIFDRNWRYVYVNENAVRLSRRCREQLLGQSLWEVFPETVGTPLHEQMQRAMREQIPLHMESYFAPYDIWSEIYAYPSPEGLSVHVTDITERKRTGEALRESESRNRAVLDAALDGIITINEKGTIESFNPAAERLFGYAAAEVLGKNVRMLMPEPYQSEHDTYLRNYLETGQRKIIGIGREVKGLRKDGSAFPLDLSVSEMRLGSRRVFIGLLHDLTERIRGEEARHQSDERLRLVVESTPSALVMVDSEGRMVLVNSQAEKLFGFAREELIGASVDILLPSRFRERHNGYRRGFLSNLQNRPMGAGRDLFALRKDGTEVPVEIGLNPIVTGDDVLILAAIVDITERKLIEQQRERLLANERAARSEAERAARMKDDFLATVSHELRTPLNAILGWSQLLGAGDASSQDEIRQGLAIIERNARGQAMLIDDLLDMSRITSGRLRLDVLQVNLVTVIEAAMESVRPAADAKQIRLERELDPAAGPIRGDPSRLQQVAWNLLSNAIKFTPPGGQVQVALRRAGATAEIVISDTGVGIKPQFAPHLFERFRQSDATITRRHGGLGLGLAIVRDLVEMHGGSVRAFSAGEGRGTTVTVTLPVATASLLDAAPLSMPTPPPVSDARASLHGIRLLVVDDDAEAREMMRRAFSAHGAQVQTASSSADALCQFQANPPDVLISDIGMPEEDGYTLIRKIRSLPSKYGGAVPALALTALARAEDRAQAMSSGYQAHLAKPVEMTDLTAKVAALAGRS